MYIPDAVTDGKIDVGESLSVLQLMHYTACTTAENDHKYLSCKAKPDGCNNECVLFNSENLLKQLLKEFTEV